MSTKQKKSKQEPKKEMALGGLSPTELSNTTDKQNSTYEVEPVEGTPFAVIQDRGYFVVMGDYRLTDRYLEKEAAKAAAKEMTWSRLMQVIGIMIDKQETVKEMFNIQKQ